MTTPFQPQFDDRGYPLTDEAARSVRVAPPTVPGALPEAPKRWPTAVGVIAIVTGGLGLLVHGLSIVSSFMMGSFMGMAATGSGGGQSDATMAEMMKMMDRYQPWMIAAAASMVMSILLLTAGIGVAGRRKWSVPTMRFWAVFRMIVVIGACIVTFMMQREQFAIMQNAQSSAAGGAGAAAGMAMMTSVMPAITVALSLLWGWALPIFMLIWFVVPKIRTETARWR